MKLRVARHTHDLEKMIHFYCTILGLKVLGTFENHDGYNGVFIGNEELPWELEFTCSDQQPSHKFDDDDLLVFYPNTQEQHQEILHQFALEEMTPQQAKNPYWKERADIFRDPDGLGVAIFRPQHLWLTKNKT